MHFIDPLASISSPKPPNEISKRQPKPRYRLHQSACLTCELHIAASLSEGAEVNAPAASV